MSSPSAPSTGRFWVMVACVAVTGITVRLLMLGKTGGHPVAAVAISTAAALIGWRAAITGGGDAPETPANRQKPRIELRDVLIATYTGYWRFETAIASILRLLLAFGFFWIALKVAEFGWNLRLFYRVPCIVITLWAFLIGFGMTMAALPGLTPKPRQYEPGRARTASIKDVRRNGLLEE